MSYAAELRRFRDRHEAQQMETAARSLLRTAGFTAGRKELEAVLTAEYPHRKGEERERIIREAQRIQRTERSRERRLSPEEVAASGVRWTSPDESLPGEKRGTVIDVPKGSRARGAKANKEAMRASRERGGRNVQRAREAAAPPEDPEPAPPPEPEPVFTTRGQGVLPMKAAIEIERAADRFQALRESGFVEGREARAQEVAQEDNPYRRPPGQRTAGMDALCASWDLGWRTEDVCRALRAGEPFTTRGQK